MSGKTTSVWHLLWAALLLGAAGHVQADDNDPPTRVARLAYLDGGVSFRPAGSEDWVEAGLNRPLTIGDQLWSDQDGRIEVQLDGSNLRLGTQTSAGILNLTDDGTQIQLSSGTLIVHVRQLANDESYEIDTPNVAFSILRPGTYRLSVDPDGTRTAIAVRSGQGEAVGGGGTGYTVRAGEYDTFSGTDAIVAASAGLGPQDEFDAWSAERDGRFDRSRSAQYVSPDVVGYEELDNQGNWDDTPEYGHVWFPSGVEGGWAPYQRGHWAYVAPWGYTWIDDRPWGFAPFHYGRWVFWRQRWGWVPVAPPVPREVYVRPVYAPALVAWVGGGATIGWFALGPREVYVPAYPVSRNYLNVVNVSNTRINTTIINNVYNTTVINRTTVNNITYANRRVPGAVMATNAQDFASARPVRRDGGIDARGIANGPVRAFAPAVVPTRAAVYGGRGPANLRPSQAVQTRVTAARMAPAAAVPSIDARLQALRDSGGRAPDRAQLARAAAPPPVRVVPPVRTLVSSRDFDSARAPGSPAAPGGSTRPPANARDMPADPRTPAPGTVGRAAERPTTEPPARPRVPPPPPVRVEAPAADARRQQLEAQQNAQRQVQSQAGAELARRQQLDQQRNAQLEQVQAQQRAQADAQSRVQQQAQAQAEQQRAAQLERQRQLEQQVQQQRDAQRAQQQEQQRAQAETQARAQQQAQAQAEQQRSQQQQLERQREAGQLQYQRQQQALEAQRATRERQAEQPHPQQSQPLQQQSRAREDNQERQQAVQRQVDPQRRPPQTPPQNPRQPH